MTHRPWSNICPKLWSAKLGKTHSFWFDKGADRQREYVPGPNAFHERGVMNRLHTVVDALER
jgi:hypothetical protein